MVATFGPDGPTTCSGLPIVRYTHDELAAQFPGDELVSTSGEDHVTPWGSSQKCARPASRRSHRPRDTRRERQISNPSRLRPRTHARRHGLTLWNCDHHARCLTGCDQHIACARRRLVTRLARWESKTASDSHIAIARNSIKRGGKTRPPDRSRMRGSRLSRMTALVAVDDRSVPCGSATGSPGTQRRRKLRAGFPHGSRTIPELSRHPRTGP